MGCPFNLPIKPSIGSGIKLDMNWHFIHFNYTELFFRRQERSNFEIEWITPWSFIAPHACVCFYFLYFRRSVVVYIDLDTILWAPHSVYGEYRNHFSFSSHLELASETIYAYLCHSFFFDVELETLKWDTRSFTMTHSFNDCRLRQVLVIVISWNGSMHGIVSHYICR